MFPEPALQEPGPSEKVIRVLMLIAEGLAVIRALIGFPVKILFILRLTAFKFRFRNIIILRLRPRLTARTNAAYLERPVATVLATSRPAVTMILIIVWNGLLTKPTQETLPVVTESAPTIKGQAGIAPAEVSLTTAFTILLALRCRLLANVPRVLAATVAITKAQA